jgi:hypothetical protein
MLEDGMLAPGEPLKEAIDPSNAALMDQELRKRLERMQAKLTKKQLKQMHRREKWLRRRLNAGRWNSLLIARDEVWEQYQQCQQAWAAETNPKNRQALKNAALRHAAAGRGLNAQIERLKPLADERAEVLARLEAHKSALAAELEDEENYQAFVRESEVWLGQIKAVFRNYPKLHHKGTDNEGRDFIIIPQISHVHILTDRIMYQVRTSEQGLLERMTGRWHSALPYGVNITDLMSEETLTNLSAFCNRVVTIERSKKGTTFYYVVSRLDSPDGIPDRVLFSRLWTWYPREIHFKTPWFAGMSANRKIEHFDFESYPHMLVAGSTKSGKSNFINQLIATIVQANSPDELRLLLVDLKGGVEFVHWQGLKHLLMPIVKRPDEVVPALKRIRTILDRRMELFEKVKIKNFSAYNAQAAPGSKLARLVIFIDEMATLVEQEETKVEADAMMATIASQGRAFGIHMVICTQRPSADVVKGWIKTNASLLVSGKMPHYNSSLIILGTDTAANIPSIAGRMVFSRGRDEIIVQTPLISDEEIARAVAISATYDDPDEREFDDAQAFLTAAASKHTFSEDDVIEMALTRLNGKLSPSRMIELIPDKTITEHMIRKLVARITEDGVGAELVYNGRRYRIGKLGKSYTLKPIDVPVEEAIDADYRAEDDADAPIEPETPSEEDESAEEEYA